jgi:hypothetical protein
MFVLVPILSLKGKTVKIRRGPAAVNGDENRIMPLFNFNV